MNLAILWVAACVSAPSFQDRAVHESEAWLHPEPATQALRLDGRLLADRPPFPITLADLPSYRGPFTAPDSVPDMMQGEFPRIVGELDLSRGRKLMARLEELPPERYQIGVAGLPYGELFGPDPGSGLCKSPRVEYTFRHEGQRWEASLELPAGVTMLNPLQPDLSQISPECVADLDAMPFVDALAQGRCNDDADHHFWAGTECLACLESGSTWTECAAADQCHAEAPTHVRWAIDGFPEDDYGVVHATTLMCAPQIITYTILLYRLDDARPVQLQAFDYDRWVAKCFPNWDEAANDVAYVCNVGGHDTKGDMVAAGVFGRAHTIRPIGDERMLHQGRTWWSPSVQLNATFELQAMWLHYDRLGSIASPYEPVDLDGNGEHDLNDVRMSESKAWGFQPYELRPDGTDPSRLDDTYARDYIGALALKTATQYDGIPISPFITNRCAEGAWEELADGRSRCTRLGPHHLDAPVADDAYSVILQDPWSGRLARVSTPVTTLASTGLPDRTVPGGVLIDVRGSTSLAKPGWEACAWPQTFEPDLTVLDAVPGLVGPSSPLMAQTYRIGKEAPGVEQVRIGLNTSYVRDFCPEHL